MNTLNIYYLVPFAVVILLYILLQRKREKSSIAQREQAKKAGLTEPASLHPVIDPARCLGSGACVTACPEGDVLGMIRRKAELINPAKCIGHGACQRACPHNAITLVLVPKSAASIFPMYNPILKPMYRGCLSLENLGVWG